MSEINVPPNFSRWSRSAAFSLSATDDKATSMSFNCSSTIPVTSTSTNSVSSSGEDRSKVNPDFESEMREM